MSTDDPRLCEQHTWVAVGVTSVDGSVLRVWICEQCPAWTRQPLEGRFEVDWDDASVRTA